MIDTHIASLAADEIYRLKVLAEAQLLDSPPEAAFDALVMQARRVIGAPTALLSLVDSKRQWFKARCGFPDSETSRDVAFCNHAIQRPDIMIVEDARRDPRFSENPLVTADNGIVFYAGVPLLMNGQGEGPTAAIGTICVIDHVPRMLTEDQIDALRELAVVAVTLIEGRILALQAVTHAEERHLAAHRLEYERRKFKQAERMAGLGYWRLDIVDNSLYWSDQTYAIHGLPIGAKPPLAEALSFYPPQARAQISAAMAHTLETGQGYDLETDFVTAHGASRRVRSMGEVETVDGQTVAVFGVVQDVTERYRLEQVLRRSAHRDALTGIANRAALDEVLETRIAATADTEAAFVMMLIDLDGFKAVNDAMGHLAGDELLQVVAARLQAPAYANWFVSRIGGDEFVIIPNGPCDSAAVEYWAVQMLQDLRIPVNTAECRTTISGTLGITWFQKGDTRRDMMRRADQAMYAAKNSERGTARIYGSSRVIRPHDQDIRKAG